MVHLHDDPAWWRPQPGPQTLLLTCPHEEVFFGGAKGGGKTDALIGHFGVYQERYGRHARGLLVRTEYKQLQDLRLRALSLYSTIGATWKDQDQSFIFPNSARLTLAHIRTVADVAKYQGWQVPWLGVEEMGEFPDPVPLVMLQGMLRSPHGLPKFWLATGNPGGAGHAWVKEMWIDPSEPLSPFPVRDTLGRVVHNADGSPRLRVFIPARLEHNRLLMEADPDYGAMLDRQPDHIRRAWRWGDWDIAPGAYLEGLWDRSRHVVTDFGPEGPPWWWTRWKALDWGSARPYSVGWYTVRPDDGAIIRYRELYGFGGSANVGTGETAGAVADKVKALDALEPEDAKRSFNVADASIWSDSGTGRERGVSVGSVFRDAGVVWARGPNATGTRSRVPTAEVVRDYLARDRLLVAKSCRHWLRTVPILARDTDHPEDVNTDGEDHAWDETRYALWAWTSRGKAAAKTEPARAKERRVSRPVASLPGVPERKGAGFDHKRYMPS